MLWCWSVAFATGMAVIYGLNLPKTITGEKVLSVAANAIYGGWYRLAWGLAVAWVAFACCRGYGGKFVSNCFTIKAPISLFSRVYQLSSELGWLYATKQTVLHHLLDTYSHHQLYIRNVVGSNPLDQYNDCKCKLYAFNM